MEKFWVPIKYGITALLVVVVSEVAKWSERVGGLLAALPLVTILTLVWLHVEKQPSEKISKHAWYTFWYVVPTLPMFFLFPWLYNWLDFWWTLLLVSVFTILVFEIFALYVSRWGIELM
ncbi:hypothetical protein ABL78_4772 [Leptomonas seymouri]|uniref:DUF3147 family protein n=1 Tax=Leptomonas seymouri TaxID=5684 RepID=A0A0N1I324_LEPSE|nr:hypothetical protein ABL78_4772 [Leptomonas seymouri]|eukprot:KPI86150.1 hypothetical protein ABL78_4772 [Leptomonas seymouri]